MLNLRSSGRKSWIRLEKALSRKRGNMQPNDSWQDFYIEQNFLQRNELLVSIRRRCSFKWEAAE